MGDFKSEMVRFVADSDVPDSFDEPLTDIFGRLVEVSQARGDAEMEFDNYSDDHWLFVGDFLRLYALDPNEIFGAWIGGDPISLRFTSNAQCRRAWHNLADWEAQFLANPEPILMLLRDELLKVPAGYVSAEAIGMVNVAFLLMIYHHNDGRGYHVPSDGPCGLLLDGLGLHTNIMSAANQGFGYLKAMRGWLQAADERGVGLMALTW